MRGTETITDLSLSHTVLHLKTKLKKQPLTCAGWKKKKTSLTEVCVFLFGGPGHENVGEPPEPPHVRIFV